MNDDEQQQDSPRLQALVAYLKSISAYIDEASAGSVTLHWDLSAPISGRVTLRQPTRRPPAVVEGTTGGRGFGG